MKRVIGFLFFISIGLVVGIKLTSINPTQAAEAVPPPPGLPSTSEDAVFSCIGQALAKYMNAVATGAGGLPHIKILTPAFNMGSYTYPYLYQYMKLWGANFNAVDGIAGNLYNVSGQTISGFISQRQSEGYLPNKPLYLTEIGDWEFNWGRLTSEINNLRGNSAVNAALIFNAYNNNPTWSALTPPIGTVCSGSCNPKIGANFATYYTTGNYDQAGNDGMTFTLEIAHNDINSVLPGIKMAHARGMTPIVRIGVGNDSGGFKSPSTLISLAQAISSQVDRDVFIIAGPNEPDAESWLTPSCTLNTRPKLSDFTPFKYPCINEKATVADPEYQPLRPYPFSPCDPLIPQRNSLNFQCGNSINPRGAFVFPQIEYADAEVLPPLNSNDPPPLTVPHVNSNLQSGLYRCEDDPTKHTICSISRIPFNVTIDVTNAQLPVVGNTTNDLTDELKVNNYLDWYLNGTVQHSDPNKSSFPGSETDEDRLINFSGPIKKLLSQNTQKTIKETLLTTANFDDKDLAIQIHNYIADPKSRARIFQEGLGEKLFANVPFSSLEDMMGEYIVTVIAETQPGNNGVPPIDGKAPKVYPIPVPFTSVGGGANAIRLVIKRPSDSRLYLPHLKDNLTLAHYLQRIGDPLYVGAPNLKPNIYKEVTSALTSQQHQGIGFGDDRNIQVWEDPYKRFSAYDVERPTRNTEIRETAGGLGDPHSYDCGFPGARFGDCPAPEPPADKIGKPLTTFDQRCDIGNIVVAPGDPIAPEKRPVNLPGGPVINARLTYTQLFRYPAVPPPNCIDRSCSGATGKCLKGTITGATDNGCGSYYSCEIDYDITKCQLSGNFEACMIEMSRGPGTCRMKETITIPTEARVAVFSKIPFIDQIYNTLVAGPESLLRRMLPYPKGGGIMPSPRQGDFCSTEYIRGETEAYQGSGVAADPRGTCVRPASTSIKGYIAAPGKATSAHPSVPSGITVSAGADRKGDAQLYFPYLGSLFDYFLGSGEERLNLQKVLRPFGIGSSSYVAQGPNDTPTDRTLACNINLNACSQVDFSNTLFQTFINRFNSDWRSNPDNQDPNFTLVGEAWAQQLINSASLCPSLAATLWLEESGGSALGGYDMGCIYNFGTGTPAAKTTHLGGPPVQATVTQWVGNKYFSDYDAFRNHYYVSLAGQIGCLNSYISAIRNNSTITAEDKFRTFMCQYSGEPDTDPNQDLRQCTTFANNPNFPRSVCSIGNDLGVTQP